MKGKIKIIVKNRHITFSLMLERNVTVITGDSGTGKTKLINMIRDYAELGKASGITLTCKQPCMVLSGKDWERTLSETKSSVVFVEESSPFLTSHDFAKEIQKSDNYYVLVTREPLPQIAYSIAEIKQIVKNGNKPKFDKIYKDISVRDISKFDYDAVIVEDGKAGYQFFSKAVNNDSVKVVPANGKSNILSLLDQHKKKSILVIADAAALGSEIRELVRFKEISDNRIDFFLPESFEWLILKSGIFSGNNNVCEILENPIEYIESKDYFSWERFFADLLIRETKGKPKLEYKKNNIAEGYVTEANISTIVNAMKKKK